MPHECVYLEKVLEKGDIDTWIVDGDFIRTNIDEEFCNFGHHFCFNFIPEFEFWIDRELSPDEMDFFIDHMLVSWKLMRKGCSFDLAEERAGSKERSERIKAGDLDKITSGSGEIEPAQVHLKILGKAKGNLGVWLVDGRLVRSGFFIDFTEGGHDLVYRFVPRNEVWIDNDLSEDERSYVILHELNERDLMLKGLSYSEAHAKSSTKEWAARHDKLRLSVCLVLLGFKAVE